MSVSAVREDLRRVEKPVNDILKDTSADPDEHREVLRDYVHSSARAIAAKVANTDSVARDSKDSSQTLIPLTEHSSDMFYGSFDEWLASFTPTIGELKTTEQRLEFMRSQRKETIAAGMLQ